MRERREREEKRERWERERERGGRERESQRERERGKEKRERGGREREGGEREREGELLVSRRRESDGGEHERAPCPLPCVVGRLVYPVYDQVSSGKSTSRHPDEYEDQVTNTSIRCLKDSLPLRRRGSPAAP